MRATRFGGAPGAFVDIAGARWSPDLRKTENRVTIAILVRM
jgi:hypothetical protein